VELLKRPEGKTLEYKRHLSSPEGAMKALVAFANTSGGVLAIGIENRTRRVLGIRHSTSSPNLNSEALDFRAASELFSLCASYAFGFSHPESNH
jgi:predicted HTH transcriptional regulator